MLRSWSAGVAGVALLAVGVACGAFSSDAAGDDGGAIDATIDAVTADGAPLDATSEATPDAGPRCRVDDPFGAPTELDSVNTQGVKSGHPTLRQDEKEMFYQRGASQIYVARRGDRTLPFDVPQLLQVSGADGGALSAQDPSITTDGLTLYVGVFNQLARLERPSLTAPFGPPVFIGLDDPAQIEGDPHILPGNEALYFARDEDGGSGIWRAPRSATNTFPTADRLDLGGSSAQHPTPGGDELVLYFANTVDGAIYRATRLSTAKPFGVAARVAELSISAVDGGVDRPAWLSPDQCRMYLSSGPGLAAHLYVAERAPR
jgi:hypothetical protein